MLCFDCVLNLFYYVYNTIHSRHSIDTPHTVWSQCYRLHGWLGTTTPKIDRNRCMPKIRTRLCRENSK